MITAKAADGSGKKAVYTITGMEGVVKKVTISGKKTVKAGKSIKLKAKVKATKKANTRLFWKSSNQKFATVKNGKVKAKKNAKGKKVLVIDTDPQGNTTSGFGIEKNELEDTIYELILGECSIRDCIISNVIKNVSVVPSNVNLAAAEIELIGVDKKEFILKNEVDYV